MVIDRDKLIHITFRGLSRDEIDSLHDFLKEQKGVTNIYTHVRKVDASSELLKVAATIAGLAITLGPTVSRKAVDITAEWVRDWLKKHQTEDPNVEVTIIYGADGETLSRIKKSPPPKAK